MLRDKPSVWLTLLVLTAITFGVGYFAIPQHGTEPPYLRAGLLAAVVCIFVGAIEVSTLGKPRGKFTLFMAVCLFGCGVLGIYICTEKWLVVPVAGFIGLAAVGWLLSAMTDEIKSTSLKISMRWGLFFAFSLVADMIVQKTPDLFRAVTYATMWAIAYQNRDLAPVKSKPLFGLI